MELDNPDEEAAIEAFGGPVRRCSRCLEWLPSDKEFWNATDPARWCKACESDYGKAITK